MVRLTKREQRFAIVMAAVVAVWGIYGLAIRPARQRIATLERIIPEKEQELAQIQEQSREYRALHREFAELQSRMARQDPNFELPSFLESVIERQRLTARMVGMQRSELQSPSGQVQTLVEISFENIGFKELIGFLRAIEESDAPTTVGVLHIGRKEGRAAGLDAKVQILSPQRSPNAVASSLP